MEVKMSHAELALVRLVHRCQIAGVAVIGPGELALHIPCTQEVAVVHFRIGAQQIVKMSVKGRLGGNWRSSELNLAGPRLHALLLPKDCAARLSMTL